MTVMQIRDVPDEVHAVFVGRARAARQSLQQYMRALLIREAQRPDAAQIFARAAERTKAAGSSFPMPEAVADIRALREDGPQS